MKRVIMASAAEGSNEREIFEAFNRLDDRYKDRMGQMMMFQNKLKERIANKTVFDPILAVSVENFVAEKLHFAQHLRLKILEKRIHLKSYLQKRSQSQEGHVRELATELKNMFALMSKTLNDYEENEDVRFYELQLEISRIVSDEKNAKWEYIETFNKLDDGYKNRMDQMMMFQNKLQERIENNTVLDPISAVSVENFVAKKLAFLQHLRLKILDKMIHLKSCLRKRSQSQEGHVRELATELKNMFALMHKTLKDYEENEDVRFYELQLEVSRIVSDEKVAIWEHFESFTKISDRLDEVVENMMIVKDILNENLADETINDRSSFTAAVSVEKFLAEKVDYLRKLRLKLRDKLFHLKFFFKVGSLCKDDHLDALVSEIENIDEAMTRTLHEYNGNAMLLRYIVDIRKKE